MRYIEIKLTKCKLFLTESEIRELLRKDMDLFTIGIQRGKGIHRFRQFEKRATLKSNENEYKE